MESLLIRGDRLLLALEVFDCLAPDACAALHSDDPAERERYEREFNPCGLDRARVLDAVNHVLLPERRALAQLTEAWVPAVVRPILAFLRTQPAHLLQQHWDAVWVLDQYQPTAWPASQLSREEVRDIVDLFRFGDVAAEMLRSPAEAVASVEASRPTGRGPVEARP